MTYVLRYKYDRKEPQKVRGLLFATKREAIISGQAVLAAGTGWDLEVIDEKGDVVASESEVRDGTALAG
jgi:hypothetical protein